jgi:hypothetical protein
MNGGEISGNTATSGSGGGVYNASSSPVLTNVTISDNDADGDGGGMYNSDSSPVLTNVTISDNDADGGGGGMYNSDSSPVLTNVTISGNSATGSNGGGMYNYFNSSPVLTNVIISGNSATAIGSSGGGMYNEGSSPVLTNVAILGNTATGIGGGIANFDASSPTLTNVTIAGKSVTGGGSGGGMGNSDSSPKVRNSIIWGNEAASEKSIFVDGSGNCSVTFSIVQDCDWSSTITGITDDGDNIADPGSDASPFVAWIDPAGIGCVPTSDGDYSLQDDSPAIDKGLHNHYPDGDDSIITDITTDPDALDAIAAALEKDLAGHDRIQGTEIDMGAYEKE